MSFDQSSLISRLSSIALFSNVGGPIDFSISHCTLVPVASWTDAIALRGGDRASDAFNEAGNRLARLLSARFRKEARTWNAIAREIRGALEDYVFPSVDENIERTLSTLNDEQRWLVKSSVRWDFVYFGLEQAFSNLVPPAVYTDLMMVYDAGHFPCNWDEVWPGGQFWVF